MTSGTPALMMIFPTLHVPRVCRARTATTMMSSITCLRLVPSHAGSMFATDNRRPIRMISTLLRRLYFRSSLCLYEKFSGSLTSLELQVSNAKSVVLHYDELSTLRRFLDKRMEFDSLARYDLLKRLLIDKDGGCTSISFTSQCC